MTQYDAEAPWHILPEPKFELDEFTRLPSKLLVGTRPNSQDGKEKGVYADLEAWLQDDPTTKSSWIKYRHCHRGPLASEPPAGTIFVAPFNSILSTGKNTTSSLHYAEALVIFYFLKHVAESGLNHYCGGKHVLSTGLLSWTNFQRACTTIEAVSGHSTRKRQTSPTETKKVNGADCKEGDALKSSTTEQIRAVTQVIEHHEARPDLTSKQTPRHLECRATNSSDTVEETPSKLEPGLAIPGNTLKRVHADIDGCDEVSQQSKRQQTDSEDCKVCKSPIFYGNFLT